MQNLWRDDEARAAIARYAEQGVNEDLALRTYTTRLLGGEPRLVLHGGGNTSVKTVIEDICGDAVEVLCVKGSGWDMGSIEPPGLPAVQLAPLRRLRALDHLSDEEMVNQQRLNLLDSQAPNPSVETLLHAFLPHKFVDHTHSNAVLALTDQPNGAEICAAVYGDRVALVPYIMPGFALAKKAAEVQEANPDCEGMVLLKHGVFSFGDTAKEAYDRMIDLVSMAEARLAETAGADRQVFAGAELPTEIAAAAEVAPLLRGLLAVEIDPENGKYDRFVLSFRSSEAIRRFVDGADLKRYGLAGTVTPDHSIRIKSWPVVLPPPKAGRLDEFAAGAAKAIAEYEVNYIDYFTRNNQATGGDKTQLDPAPRVALVPGLGLFAVGNSAKAAGIAGDLAETTIDVITAAESMGRFESIPEPDLFDIEYWSLEQAKLGKAKEKPLSRHVVAITGGAGAIGAATAAAFAAAGAEVALIDRDADALATVAVKLPGALAVPCDVTDRASVDAAFSKISEAFGGVDILVSNAGAAWQGRIGEVSDEVLRRSFELNFFAHQSVAQAAVAIMEKQKTGGVLLFNVSKQAVNPGPNFGPYGLPKAATLSLVRQYAVDYGADGIRANAVNADRIRSGLLTEDMVEQRSTARGVSRETYMRGNLLKREVYAKDVAQAFVDLALAEKTTGSVTTVDGGNIAAALR